MMRFVVCVLALCASVLAHGNNPTGIEFPAHLANFVEPHAVLALPPADCEGCDAWDGGGADGTNVSFSDPELTSGECTCLPTTVPSQQVCAQNIHAPPIGGNCRVTVRMQATIARGQTVCISRTGSPNPIFIEQGPASVDILVTQDTPCGSAILLKASIYNGSNCSSSDAVDEATQWVVCENCSGDCPGI